MTEGAAGGARSGDVAAPEGVAELPHIDVALAALGPFFAVDRHVPADPPAGTWRPLKEIVDDPDVLGERVAAVRQFLAAGGGASTEGVELRVAASVTHLGMAARLTSPLLATAALRGRVPLITLDDLRWQPLLGGAFPLSLPRESRAAEIGDCHGDGIGEATHDAKGQDGDSGVLFGALSAVLLDGVARPLAGAFTRFGVSEPILRGNTASALAGAARMLAGASDDGRSLVRELLRQPYLADAGEYAPPERRSFRRRSCCLIYRAAPGRNGALCGDCVLDHPAART